MMRMTLKALTALCLGSILAVTACGDGTSPGEPGTGTDTKTSTGSKTGTDTKTSTNTNTNTNTNTSGGSGKLGAACTGGSDCASGLTCETQDLPGGMCTKSCSGQGSCGADADCLAGKCFAKCDKNNPSSCGRNDFACDFYTGLCQPTGPVALGKSCAIDSCASGLSCSPDGLCSKPCTADSECGANGLCRDFPDWGVKYCAVTCSASVNKNCGDTTDPNDAAAALKTGIVCRLGLKAPRCQAIGTLGPDENCLPNKGFCEADMDCKGKEGVDYPVCTPR